MVIASGYAENGVAAINNSTSKATITITYEQPDFWLTRTVTIGEYNSSADITYRITPKNATLKEFRINAWSLFETSAENCNVDKDGFVTISHEYIKSTIQVVETSGNLMGARIIFSDPEDSRPVTNYIFEATQSDLYVHLRVNIEVPKQDQEPEGYNEIKVHNSYDKLRDLGIDYIMLNKYREHEFQRFLQDSTHFTVEYENDIIIIFKVVD
jgi:hypothetical protein